MRGSHGRDPVPRGAATSAASGQPGPAPGPPREPAVLGPASLRVGGRCWRCRAGAADERPGAGHLADRYLDEDRLMAGQCLAEGSGELAGGGGALAVNAEVAGEGGEVGVGQAGADEPAAELVPLVAPDVAVGAVGEHHGHEADAVFAGGGQLLQAVAEPAVAGDGDNRDLGFGGLGAQGGGEPVAERSLVAGAEVGA